MQTFFSKMPEISGLAFVVVLHLSPCYPVSNFFRDREAFQTFAAELLKLLAEKKPDDPARIWVPGCATGEEAYSIAMLLSESATKLNFLPSIRVFATDVNQALIDQGRSGFYHEAITADVPEERLRQFLCNESAGYRLRRDVREMVTFGLHDLLKDPPSSHLDLISCRNLLTYFDCEAQRRSLEIGPGQSCPDPPAPQSGRDEPALSIAVTGRGGSDHSS